jgi:hypothetical protein
MSISYEPPKHRFGFFTSLSTGSGTGLKNEKKLVDSPTISPYISWKCN